MYNGTSWDWPNYQDIPQQPIIKSWEYNGGGGMSGWKRASFFWTFTKSGNNNVEVQYINNKNNINFHFTNFYVTNVQDEISGYNSANGTSLTMSDINKEWCDRWIAGRGNPIIHIKDPHNTTIKFNTDYDIVCNDIEIDPTVTKVTFDETGTIKCRALVKAKEY